PLSFRLQLAGHGLSGHRHFRHFVRGDQRLKFAVRQFLYLLERMNEVMDEDHRPNRKEDVPDGERNLLVHRHTMLLKLSPELPQDFFWPLEVGDSPPSIPKHGIEQKTISSLG